MIKTRVILALFLLILSILIVGCGVSEEQYDSIVAERDTLKSQLLSTQNELESIKSELESIKSELTLAHTELAKTKEDNPRYSLNEVKASIATSLYSKLPDEYKTFDRTGPRLGEIWVRSYDDFAADAVNVLYLENGEWTFIATTLGSEYRSEYLGVTSSGAWQYRVKDTTFVLEVEGIYFERISKFNIRRIERVDETELTSIREI